ncbi:hypothetical protein [Nonomuraea wenchangensis]|uniref:Lipoprotein LprG n=1 Tax=Nonomuraea wenchangensis TaxID=568860 RepID=A0A1I0D805_9ACTN|nr:hypothetical protein [Nonomuraea wenchangensis]SET28391.1 hypothetical protein SAMN05421811_102619 [Nonomuraea wenchangensis]
MKRTIVGVAVVAGALQLAVAAPAQAAQKIDPVKVLKSELARGKGVNVRATAKVTYSAAEYISTTLDGTVEFDARGARAADTSQNLSYSKSLLAKMAKVSPRETETLQHSPVRVLSSGRVSYVSGAVVQDALPEGTSWVRYGGTDVPSGNLLLDVLEPATLKALMDHRASWSGGVVKGTIKPNELAKASASFVARYGEQWKKSRTGKISYALSLSAGGRVERVSVKGELPFDKGSVRIESDTTYTEWGRQVTVLLPLRGEVIDQPEVKDEVPAQAPALWS